MNFYAQTVIVAIYSLNIFRRKKMQFQETLLDFAFLFWGRPWKYQRFHGNVSMFLSRRGMQIGGNGNFLAVIGTGPMLKLASLKAMIKNETQNYAYVQIRGL